MRNRYGVTGRNRYGTTGGVTDRNRNGVSRAPARARPVPSRNYKPPALPALHYAARANGGKSGGFENG